VQRDDFRHFPLLNLESQAAATVAVASKPRFKALNPAREPFGVGLWSASQVYPSFADHPELTSLVLACAFTKASRKPDQQHQHQRTHRGSRLDRNWIADALSAADEDRIASSWIWPWPRASQPLRRDRMHLADRLATHHKDRTQCQTIRLQATRALEGASRVRAYRWAEYIADMQLQRQRASRACEVREQSNSFCTSCGQVYLGTEDQSRLYQLLIKHHPTDLSCKKGNQ
jgi:hypothetical protein